MLPTPDDGVVPLTIITALPGPYNAASPATVVMSPTSPSNDAGAAPPMLTPLSQAGERYPCGDASDLFLDTTLVPSFGAAPAPCSNCGHARQDAFNFPSVPTLTDAHTRPRTGPIRRRKLPLSTGETGRVRAVEMEGSTGGRTAMAPRRRCCRCLSFQNQTTPRAPTHCPQARRTVATRATTSGDCQK